MRDTRHTSGPVRDLLQHGSAEPFRAIVAEAADGIVGIDASQRISIFNRAAEAMFGYAAAEAIGQPLTMLLPAEVKHRHEEHVRGFQASSDRARYMGQRHEALRARRADGSEFAVAISILQLGTDNGPLMVAHVHDISEKVALLEQQVHLATRDSLTGALNRRAFLEQAEAVHGRWAEAAAGYCLLMLDLDHFKAVNDNYGHAVGDAVLQEFSQLCSTTLRTDDLFARWGGEEFVALLPAATPSAARAVAERIRMRVAKRAILLAGGQSVRQTVSIGVATPLPPAGLDDVIRRADDALYAAKSAGRNRVHAADAASRQTARRA